MNIRVFQETEFVYLFLCTVHFREKTSRFIVPEFVKLSDEVDIGNLIDLT